MGLNSGHYQLSFIYISQSRLNKENKEKDNLILPSQLDFT